MSVTWLKTGLVVISVCLTPILAQAQKAVVDYDRDVDFSKFRTYAWMSGQPAPNPLVDRRIISAIEGQLAAKGWAQVSASPSAIVVYQAAVDQQKQLNAWGRGPRWSGTGTVSVETIVVGQLVVDVLDAASKQLLWRGSVSDSVSDKPEKNEKKLNEAVAKLFRQFPPAPRSKVGS